jgi:lipoyl(octanoyl) transferase
MSRGAYLMNLAGLVPYQEAWDLQRSLAAAVSQGSIPDTVMLLEHKPVITLGRRTEEGEVHVPAGADVEIVETDRGGKSTYHGPGQLVCYPIFDLTRHGQDVKRYCRDLEEALIRTLAPLGIEATRIEGLTGIWLTPPPRKIASIGVHISRWITTRSMSISTLRRSRSGSPPADSRIRPSRPSPASSVARSRWTRYARTPPVRSQRYLD